MVERTEEIKMFGKIQILGQIEVVTGMHIGGSSAFAAIGAVDSPIVRDVNSHNPMIPGSSLKGKIRTLLAKEFNDAVVSPDDDSEKIARLFGTAKKNKVRKSRVQFSDMILSNADELHKLGLQSLTEVKFENSINRATAVANPRQIERAVRGSIFPIDIIYEIEDERQIEEDFETLAEGLKLLQFDYLGGSGSRGYGRVKFNNLSADVVIGEVREEIIGRCNDILRSVEA